VAGSPLLFSMAAVVLVVLVAGSCCNSARVLSADHRTGRELCTTLGVAAITYVRVWGVCVCVCAHVCVYMCECMCECLFAYVYASV
jgi:hypothetical protein